MLEKGKQKELVVGCLVLFLSRFAVPKKIEGILQAADEIQAEDPDVARILCEQAFSMAQDLDPNSDGRGLLQFKIGLMSVIKQRLSKRDTEKVDHNPDIERLW